MSREFMKWFVISSWRTDFAPADFFLFPTLENALKWHRLQNIEEIKENMTRQLRAIKQNAFQETFQKWKKGWQPAIASGGDYFEGDSLWKLCKLLKVVLLTVWSFFFFLTPFVFWFSVIEFCSLEDLKCMVTFWILMLVLLLILLFIYLGL